MTPPRSIPDPVRTDGWLKLVAVMALAFAASFTAVLLALKAFR